MNKNQKAFQKLILDKATELDQKENEKMWKKLEDMDTRIKKNHNEDDEFDTQDAEKKWHCLTCNRSN